MTSILAPISVHTTLQPPTDADIMQYSSIRLDALRIDPDSFASTYARESRFDRAKWRERLEQEGAWIFYAKCDEVDEFGEKSGEGRHRHGPVSMSKISRAWPKSHTHTLLSLCVRAEDRTDRGSGASVLTSPWLATLTLLSPSFLTSSSPIPTTSATISSRTPAWPLSLLGPETDLWLIVGLWVRPEWRRQGIGHKIVQKAVHFVTTSLNHSHSDGATTFETPAQETCQRSPGSCNSKTTLILLEVYTRNTAAVDLYRSVGFEILSNPDQPAFPEPAQAIGGANTNGTNVGGAYEMQEHKTHWMGYTIPSLLPHRSNL